MKVYEKRLTMRGEEDIFIMMKEGHKILSKEILPKGTLPKETLPKETLPKETLPKETL